MSGREHGIPERCWPAANWQGLMQEACRLSVAPTLPHPHLPPHPPSQRSEPKKGNWIGLNRRKCFLVLLKNADRECPQAQDTGPGAEDAETGAHSLRSSHAGSWGIEKLISSFLATVTISTNPSRGQERDGFVQRDSALKGAKLESWLCP